MIRILSVSYDPALLRSRQLLLESLGFEVLSAGDYSQALQHCRSDEKFDVLVVGHSIPCAEKRALIAAYRACRSTPVVALKKIGEEATADVDFYIEPDPAGLLSVISRILHRPAASA